MCRNYILIFHANMFTIYSHIVYKNVILESVNVKIFSKGLKMMLLRVQEQVPRPIIGINK